MERNLVRGLAVIATAFLGTVSLAAEDGRRSSPAPQAASVFDPPLLTKHVKLGPGRADPAQKNELTCFYFSQIRVKVLDLGEVGAAQLAILPLKPGSKPPPCRKAKAAGEMVVPGEQWSGYFKGVKSGHVFFDAEDGTNGGLGFAIFDGGDGAKLFADLAVGEIRTVEPIEAGIKLRYKRAFVGSCSVPIEGMNCWSKINGQMPGVGAEPVPDCRAGYLKAKSEMARGRCAARDDKSDACFQAELKGLDDQRWDESPSVIAYDVEVVVQRSRQVVKAVGAAASCWPAD